MLRKQISLPAGGYMNKSKLKQALGGATILLLCWSIENRAVAQSGKLDEDPLHRKLNIQAIVDQDTRVYGHLRLARGCVQGPIPKINVTKPPSSGALAVKNEIVTLTAPNFGNCGPGHSGN